MIDISRRIETASTYFTSEDRARIHAGLDEILSGLLSMGPNVKAFEEEFARRIGVRHAIAVNACTSALEIALASLGLRDHDEVIVPPLTFFATGVAVHLAGGVPVFADISPDTLCLDLEDVKRRVTSRTRGVLLVHMAGLMTADIAEFRRFCDQKGLFFLEDAAHAPGASFARKSAGSWGHAGCFSFYPTKVITAGEGGMITTDDDRVAGFARSLQNRGRDMLAAQEQYALPGRNVRMTELTALVGRVQLGHLDEFLDARRRLAAGYRSALGVDERVQWIVPKEPAASSFWKVPLLLKNGVNRAIVTDALRQAGIQADWGYHPPMHLQPVFRALQGNKEGLLPRSEEILSRLICLPCHPRIDLGDATRVGAALRKGLDQAA